MASLYLSLDAERGKSLSLKPLTNRLAQYIDPPPTDTSGYFLVEEVDGEASILARVSDEDAALRLGKLLGLS
ncbi:hypothetical protein [Novosphingobium sp.]|uniref:hypothetical protein n=1 Tax=Novosphingobium sp. TaxID=1874826 RepID=UPI003BA86D91